MKQIRPAAVAGMFYTADSRTLAGELAAMLEEAAQHMEKPATLPKAVIVPHAGYIYSGPIAASAYALLEYGRNIYRRVVLLGPVHLVPVHGLALPRAEGFATPLGIIPLDLDAIAMIAGLPQVVEYDAAHSLEHSLEVQLPFLQTVLEDFKLVPLAVGDVTPQEVAEVLERLWGGPETLIVISSDLSHFLTYREAQQIDNSTAQAILDLRWPINHEQACGGTPVNGLLLAAQRHHLKPHLLNLRNSGDTAGDKSRVVGYGAFSFIEEHAHAD